MGERTVFSPQKDKYRPLRPSPKIGFFIKSWFLTVSQEVDIFLWEIYWHSLFLSFFSFLAPQRKACGTERKRLKESEESECAHPTERTKRKEKGKGSVKGVPIYFIILYFGFSASYTRPSLLGSAIEKQNEDCQ